VPYVENLILGAIVYNIHDKNKWFTYMLKQGKFIE